MKIEINTKEIDEKEKRILKELFEKTVNASKLKKENNLPEDLIKKYANVCHLLAKRTGRKVVEVVKDLPSKDNFDFDLLNGLINQGAVMTVLDKKAMITPLGVYVLAKNKEDKFNENMLGNLIKESVSGFLYKYRQLEDKISRPWNVRESFWIIFLIFCGALDKKSTLNMHRISKPREIDEKIRNAFSRIYRGFLKSLESEAKKIQKEVKEQNEELMIRMTDIQDYLKESSELRRFLDTDEPESISEILPEEIDRVIRSNNNLSTKTLYKDFLNIGKLYVAKGHSKYYLKLSENGKIDKNRLKRISESLAKSKIPSRWNKRYLGARLITKAIDTLLEEHRRDFRFIIDYSKRQGNQTKGFNDMVIMDLVREIEKLEKTREVPS
ncbi:MAG: hypothetical protein ACOC44_18820 [Promethearchaeia archaeon]